MARLLMLLALAGTTLGVLAGCSGSADESPALNGPPPEVAPSNNPERMKRSEGR
ncbi:MAG: hypothetical protein QE269_09155 [Fimbriimonas sp.]|nr:hypothetical protein [Fimbriimonas sp.]